jgi:hypothetical protein
MKPITLTEPTAAQAFLMGLWQVYRPQSVIHVGIGKGSGILTFWMEAAPERALVVDADGERLKSVASKFANWPEWQAVATVVGDGEEQTFYRYTYREEDGLYPPGALTAFWPALKVQETLSVTTEPLDALAEPFFAGRFIVISELMPTDAILAGAEETLKQTSLFITRVRLDEAHDGAALTHVRETIEQQGLRLCGVIESHHPTLGYAVFARDLIAQNESQANQIVATLRQEREAARQLLSQTQQMLAGVQQQHEEAKRRVAELTQERELLQQAVAVQEAERGQLVQALEAVRGELEQSKGQLQAVRGELEQAKGQLGAVRGELEQTKSQLQAKQQEIQALTTKNQENEHRLILMQEEMIKAEAQIDLIKELLLREEGL